MRHPNTGRATRNGLEEVQAEDKIQNGRVPDLQVKIHQPRGKTPGTKEASCIMKYQLAQIIKKSIGAHVVWETQLVMGVTKRGTELKIVRGRTQERKCQHQPQYSGLQSEGGIINCGKANFLYLY